MAVIHTCPLCGERMFHDKGNHVMFCAECGHVGWPHDTPVTPDRSDDGKKTAEGLGTAVPNRKKTTPG